MQKHTALTTNDLKDLLAPYRAINACLAHAGRRPLTLEEHAGMSLFVDALNPCGALVRIALKTDDPEHCRLYAALWSDPEGGLISVLHHRHS